MILPHARKASSYHHPAEIQRVVQHFLSAFEIQPQPHTRKIWIHRSEKSRRALLNEDEVLATVQKAGFEPIVFEALTLKQQIELMQQTKVLAGLHGAGLTNLMFLPENSTVLECLPEEFAAYAHPFPFRALAHAVQVRYALTGMDQSQNKFKWVQPQNAKTTVRLQKVNAPRRFDLEKLTKAVECCAS